jgi:hypothetical protein
MYWRTTLSGVGHPCMGASDLHDGFLAVIGSLGLAAQVLLQLAQLAGGPVLRLVRGDHDEPTAPRGAVHDRDINAAINVLAAGRAESLNDRGAHVRPALVPVARREAVIHPGAACSARSAKGIPVLEGGENVKAAR